MASWRELAAEILSEETPLERAPRLQSVSSLSPDILQGLARLSERTPPPLRHPEAWAEVIRDALSLRDCGWAEQALALGWHPLELFGCSRDGGGVFEGLAVWLAGRRLVLLDQTSAIARADDTYAVFNRRPPAAAGEPPVFLWNFGGRA